MKGKLLIVFYSVNGYVKRYVDIIGNALGCDAVPAKKVKASMFSAYDRILYIGSVRSGEINGIKKFSEYFDAIAPKLVVCGVGMLPNANDMANRVKAASITVTYEDKLPVFYAQGGFDISELSGMDKVMINFRLKQTKASATLNEEDTYFLRAVETPVDEVKEENIRHLIDYLDGKPVDKKLYSPPETTK